MSDDPPADRSGLPHLDERGAARMVDIAGKPVAHRRAVATAFVAMKPETVALIGEGRTPKGDVLAAARLAGITAAKRTSDLIPLCHPLALTSVTVELELREGRETASAGDSRGEAAERVGVAVTTTVETDGKTGVEMEALTAAAVAALTIYDMCKAADRGMVIAEVALALKEGGKSGRWTRQEGG